MKKLLLVPLVLLAPALEAANPPLPDFSSKSIGLPPLSLANIPKGVIAPDAPEFQLTPPRLPAVVPARPAPRKVDRSSGMPVLEPDASIDYKMIVKAPNPAIDFKLIVKGAGNEPPK